MTPSRQLAELGLALPTVATPIGSYVPAVRSGALVLCSGQLPFKDGKVMATGKVPTDVTVGRAAEAAGVAMLNALAACAHGAGGIDCIQRVVRVCVFVNSTPDFTEHPKVANGASDLLTWILGDAGKHARSAVGASSLPMNSVVEVELIVEAG